jgi:hypothetical protein
MEERLDQLFKRLATTPPDRSLDFLDVEVVRTIVKQRREARTTSALEPIRFASIGMALAMGVTVGGFTAANALTPASQPGAFPMAADLAPSSLLEGGR